MRLLEMVVGEYIRVVEHLIQTESIENNRIIVDREIFKQLLGKYNYISFFDKTKIYKDMNFIIHDKNNYTMPYKDPVLKKTIRKVIINYKTYQTVKIIYDHSVEL